MDRRYAVTHFDDVEPTPCPCGEARRAFLAEADGVLSCHRTRIAGDSRVHYHKRLTEVYYILEGSGRVELDGGSFPVRPGSAVLIKPLCRHRAVGDLTAIIVPVPAFDPDDEWFDE